MSRVYVDEAKKQLVQKRIAAEAADNWFFEKVREGFTATINDSDITVNLTDSDVTLLTGNFLLAKEADAMGLPLPPVIDRDGQPHQLSLEDLTTFMLGYGRHRAAISAEYARLKTEV